METSSLNLLNNKKMAEESAFYFCLLAEKMGFEPMRDLHLLAVFETAPLSRLGTSPIDSGGIIP